MRKFIVAAFIVLACLAPALAWAQWEPPKTIEAPGFILAILAFFARNVVIPVGFVSAIVGLQQVIKSAVAIFGGALSPRANYLIVAFLSFLSILGEKAADGTLAGGEIVAVLVAALVFIAAVLGYKVLFSEQARAWRLKKANGS